jgi:hypothetical protein
MVQKEFFKGKLISIEEELHSPYPRAQSSGVEKDGQQVQEDSKKEIRKKPNLRKQLTNTDADFLRSTIEPGQFLV